MNDRRAFLRTVAVVALFPPLLARAQQTRKTYTLAYLGQGSTSDRALSVLLARLRELGYIEGDNLTVESRFAEEDPEKLAPLAAELVKMNPQAIAVAGGGLAEIVLKHTKTIPIVALGAGQLESVEGVRSLARPGGNLTGMQTQSRELHAKRLQLLQEAVPGLRRVAVLRGLNFDGPRFVYPRDATDAAASKLGIHVRYFQFHNLEDLARVFEEMAKGHDQALVVWGNPHLNAQRKQIFDLTMKYRLPAIYNESGPRDVEEFMVYAPKFEDVVREGALYVDKILKGANPGDLAIGKPTKVTLVINLKTAKALGLTVPQSLLVLADEVIE